MRVARVFGEHRVLHDVSLAVGPGEIHGLIGPNGVGKTTLLRILAGLTDQSEGTVRVLRGDPSTVPIRRQIGWIPGGDRTFYLRLSGLENLVFFGRMYGLSARTARAAGMPLLERVGLADVGDRLTGLYSKGMLKRLAVARALIADPVLLLCDETTHDLDPEGSESVRAIFRSLRAEGISIVWATQRLAELASFADSVTVLAHGGVAFTGPFSELVAKIPARTFSLNLSTAVDQAARRILDDLGVRYQPTTGSEASLEVEVDELMPLGKVVTALTQGGYLTMGVTEKGSGVEAAYRHVLETE